MDNSSSMQPIVRKARKKKVKGEVDRSKQAEKKKRRLEKAIATSAAIRAELEKKKQMKKEGQLDTEVEEDAADAAKKKQERDELERIKQAEKKNIRLEKSIATSAAIMAELEKKKLRKLEEQKRLDEEGAAIAEKKKRCLEKAIATSAAIRPELEKKKQMKKEGQLDAAVGEDSAKNKQERDELERIKQAERKKRRLEKSIATSAAIRAELEKKKLRKLEEQRRLDEEGAAIAEAVALHVLLGEDCDDSYRNTLNQETGFKPWDSTTKFNLFSGGRNIFFPHQRCSSYAVHSNNRTRESNWSSVSYEPFARGWDNNNNNNMRISADLIAAQAVSSLQISENTDVEAIVFNGTFRR